MVSAQEYLNQHYPKEQRGSITSLEIGNKNLEGHLDLRDFVNLKMLRCYNNQLTNIDLSKNTKLETINLHNNEISANLSIFSHLTNLKELSLGTFCEKNNFYGSLKSLENCKQLRMFDIVNQPNITEGLEYLPIENLVCFGSQYSFYEKALKPYKKEGENNEIDALKKWKKWGEVKKNTQINISENVFKDKNELEKLQEKVIESSNILGEKRELINQKDNALLEAEQAKTELINFKKNSN